MFEIKVDEAQAYSEVNALLDRRKVTPKDRERLQAAIDKVAESIMYGTVTIDSEGKITQELSFPIGELTELNYAARVDAAVVNRNIAMLKVDNGAGRLMTYIKCYTGQPEAIINRLEPGDRNVAESIALFFQA